MAVAILAVSPGPDNIYTAIISLSHGKNKGMATVLGLMSGCFIHTAFVAFGISSLITQSDLIFFLIKCAGAIYLFYLAFIVYTSSPDLEVQKEETQAKSWTAYYKKGFIMNLLNPKVSLFFMAFFPGFLFDTAISTTMQFLILGSIFIVVSFFIFSVIVFFADTIATVLKKRKQAGIFLKWTQIIVFISIGFFILFSEN